jgi:DNA-binding transcriptional MerR regulator
VKTASLKEIKESLDNATQKELLAYCIHLVRFKKENKELLTYLLYEQTDHIHYIQNVNAILDSLFETVNTTQLYFAKKTIRKIIRVANRYIRYSKNSIVEIEIHLHLTEKIKSLQLPLEQNKALHNLYLSEIKKIHNTLSVLHEDEQYEYKKRIGAL